MSNFCSLCDREFETVNFVIFHLRNEHFLAESHGLKLRCVSNKKCQKVFCTFSSLRRHSTSCIKRKIKGESPIKKKKFFENNDELPMNESCDPTNKSEQFNVDNDKHTTNPYELPSANNLNTFSIASIASQNLISCNISEKKISEMLSTLEGLFQRSFIEFKNFLFRKHTEINMNDFEATFSDWRDTITQDFKQYSTKYRRDKDCKKNELYVPPIAWPIGGHWVVKKKKENYIQQSTLSSQHFNIFLLLRHWKLFLKTILLKNYILQKTTLVLKIYFPVTVALKTF